MKRTLLFSAFLFLAMPLAAAAQAVNSGDELSVRQAVNVYLSGTDSEAKKRLFSPNAKIISLVNNKIIESPVSKPYKPKANETVAGSVQKIAAIDVGGGGALVKIETTFSGGTNTGLAPQPHIQYISLLKADGEWKIVSILMPPLRFEK